MGLFVQPPQVRAVTRGPHGFRRVYTFETLIFIDKEQHSFYICPLHIQI